MARIDPTKYGAVRIVFPPVPVFSYHLSSFPPALRLSQQGPWDGRQPGISKDSRSSRNKEALHGLNTTHNC
jgi:hypothetical protein